MEIFMQDAERGLGEFISKTSEDTASHDDWLCLHIEDEIFQKLRDNPKQLFAAEGVVSSILQGVEGKTFFCGDQDLYIIVKDVPSDTLEIIGRKICDMLFGHSVKNPRITVFKLVSGGVEYVADSHNKEKLFNLSPVAFIVQDSLDKVVGKGAMDYLSDKKIKMVKDENRKPKVLLIEDDRTTRRIVAEALGAECQMTTASDASEGVEKFMSVEPDLVILDIGLPDADGHNVLDWMLWNDPDANIVVFSGDSDIENMSRAMDQGAKGFVSKPFVKKRLMRYIKDCPQHKKLH